MSDDQEILEALERLTEALQENITRNKNVIARAERMRQLRGQGKPWSEVVSEEERPLIVEMLTQNMAVLAGAGGRLRRLEARVLHDEGMSMERIAHLFGVTRQRVSELLRETGPR